MSEIISQRLSRIQGFLLPLLEKNDGPYTENHKKLLRIIEFARPESLIPYYHGYVGRPLQDRAAIARSFIAKSVYNLSETKSLIDLLHIDPVLRRLCGFTSRKSVPSAATFSRSFAEFAKLELPQKLHQAFIEEHQAHKLVQHLATDATAIEAREKANVTTNTVDQASIAKPKKKGRPKKGEIRLPKEPTRLESQQQMSLAEMLAGLPTACDIGCKKNSKGYKTSWKGYKLHISVADGDIPIAALLTSASLHDSQVALPLTKIAANRVSHLYDLMDAAYDAEVIRQESFKAGRVPLIDFNRRSKNDQRNFMPHESEHYKARSSVERVNGNLKDNFAGTRIMVQGAAKVFAHLMFGLLAISVEQTIRWFT
jgi:Transposase DDE domain/Transposase domain (DUF772)